MWEINNGLQLLAFFRAAVLGGTFCLFYDFLRAVRRVKNNSDLSVFLEDLLFFTLIAPITFCFLLALTNGELRAYIFIALINGFIIIRFTVSSLILKLFIFILSFIIKLIGIFKNIFFVIFNWFYGVLLYLYAILKRNYKKIVICFKKHLKKR